MKALKYDGPTLFDDYEDISPVADSTTQSMPRRIAVGVRGQLMATVLAQDGSQPWSEQRKRRKTYQWGTLLLEHRERGPDVWAYRYVETINGKRIRPKKIVGTVAEYPTKADAERACEYLRMQANAESAQGQITMRGLIDRYIDEVLRPALDVPLGGANNEGARIAFTTASNYKDFLRNYILPKWETYPVREFEKPEVQAFVEKWFCSLVRSSDTPNGLAPGSVAHVYAAMRQVCKFGVKWGYLHFNPFAGPDKRIELPRGSKKRLKTPAQITPAQFFALLSNLTYFPAKLAVLFAGWLGPRASEAFGLRWQDLDLESGIVSFRHGLSRGRISPLKTEASRTNFAIPEEVKKVLRDWKLLTSYNGPTDWVFASPYTKGQRPFWSSSLMRGHILPVARCLGLPQIGWHTFRHSLSAWGKEIGLPAEHRKILLRHESLEMGDRYGRVELGKQKQIQRRIKAYVTKQVRQQKQNGDLLPMPKSRKTA